MTHISSMSGTGVVPDYQRPKGPFLSACNGELESVAPKFGESWMYELG